MQYLTTKWIVPVLFRMILNTFEMCCRLLLFLLCCTFVASPIQCCVWRVENKSVPHQTSLSHLILRQVVPRTRCSDKRKMYLCQLKNQMHVSTLFFSSSFFSSNYQKTNRTRPSPNLPKFLLGALKCPPNHILLGPMLIHKKNLC